MKRAGGWNRTVLFGNFLMFSLDWWFLPRVSCLAAARLRGRCLMLVRDLRLGPRSVPSCTELRQPLVECSAQASDARSVLPCCQVNEFTQLCRATGGAFTYRWNEQGVIAMLNQIFVKPEQFLFFSFKYAHRIPPATALRMVTTPLPDVAEAAAAQA